jgi:hypothetical protein
MHLGVTKATKAGVQQKAARLANTYLEHEHGEEETKRRNQREKRQNQGPETLQGYRKEINRHGSINS